MWADGALLSEVSLSIRLDWVATAPSGLMETEILFFEANRVMPLSVAAARWPFITERLKRLVHTTKKHPLLLHEFFCLIKDVPASSLYSEKEIALCKALKGGPLMLRDAADAAGTDAYNIEMHRLEEEGVVMRCGLTPTDIMHIRGDFTSFNSEAARLGAEFVASCVDVSPEALADLVYDMMKKKLFMNIVRVLVEDQYPSFRKSGLGSELETLIAASWQMAKNGGRVISSDLAFVLRRCLSASARPLTFFCQMSPKHCRQDV